MNETSVGPAFSYEVFPPKSADGLAPMRGAVAQLAVLQPEYVSVTYGAGGSDRWRTFDAVSALSPTGVAVAGHITCVDQPKHEVESALHAYRDLGVRRVVALRGDPSGGIDGGYREHPDGFARTEHLVATAAAMGFAVSVSAYPEGHPQSPSIDHDLDVLAAKVAAGASEAVTQMFFDTDQFLRFHDLVQARRIAVPIVAGIFPIHSFPAVARFAERCGATIPDSIASRFAGLDADIETTHRVAAELAAEQIDKLWRHGVTRFHVYTLNRAELTLAVHDQLSVAVAAVGW
jgi:methylenetetrahydrofolate reductase (NADPH)